MVGATGMPVDVHRPDNVIQVETRRRVAASCSAAVVPGPGGLPVGTAGRVALLLSGGIDSPVAGWSAMRRGCTLSAIYFHSFPYTGDRTKEKVLELARKLAPWHGPLRGPRGRLHRGAEGPARPRRRRAGGAPLPAHDDAGRLAHRAGRASQGAGHRREPRPGRVPDPRQPRRHRGRRRACPSCARSSRSTRARSSSAPRRIGTYDSSIQPYDDCCQLFVPRHPATRARVQDLVAAERGLDVAAIADDVAANAERVEIS